LKLRFKATHVVLAMLCAMYFITYVDRVNIGTAASAIQKELGLTNTQLGLVFSAFAYPYLLFQIIGGWVGDHLGPRKTLFWCGRIWAAATITTASSLASCHCSSRVLRWGLAKARPFRQRRARCSIGRHRTSVGSRRADARLRASRSLSLVRSGRYRWTSRRNIQARPPAS
jgi:Major Facilitator Superfamily